MLSCLGFTEISTDFMEGALPMRGWAGARLHLATCRNCRTHLDQLRKTKRLLERGTMPGPAAEVEARLLRERGKDGSG